MKLLILFVNHQYNAWLRILTGNYDQGYTYRSYSQQFERYFYIAD
jgi:hypothetical protein